MHTSNNFKFDMGSAAVNVLRTISRALFLEQPSPDTRMPGCCGTSELPIESKGKPLTILDHTQRRPYKQASDICGLGMLQDSSPSPESAGPLSNTTPEPCHGCVDIIRQAIRVAFSSVKLKLHSTQFRVMLCIITIALINLIIHNLWSIAVFLPRSPADPSAQCSLSQYVNGTLHPLQGGFGDDFANFVNFLKFEATEISGRRYPNRWLQDYLQDHAVFDARSRNVWHTWLTSSFSHQSWEHMRGNTIGLFTFGVLLLVIRPEIGVEEFLWLILGSALGSTTADLLGAFWTPDRRSLGFSGILAGIMAMTATHGIAMVDNALEREPPKDDGSGFEPFLLGARSFMALYAALNVVAWVSWDIVGVFVGNGEIDHCGHLGGAAFGLLYASLWLWWEDESASTVEIGNARCDEFSAGSVKLTPKTDELKTAAGMEETMDQPQTMRKDSVNAV